MSTLMRKWKLGQEVKKNRTRKVRCKGSKGKGVFQKGKESEQMADESEEEDQMP